MAQLARAAEARELLEDVVGVGADFLVRGHQAEVRVEARGARMVVAGGEVHVTLQAAHALGGFLAAHDERHLGVRFVADHAVDHVGTHFLEARRPVEVRLLVKARHELHHHGDFLAAAGRVDEDLHQLAVGAGAVDRLLDRDDLRVGGRRADEVDDRRERLVGVVQQHVLPGQHLEEVGLVFKRRRQPGLEGWVLELGALHLVRDFAQAVQVHRPGDPVEVVGVQAELLQQEFGHAFRAAVGDLEPHRIAEVPVQQFALKCDAHVGDLLLVDEEVGVARDAELVAAQHVHAGEELTHMGVQDRREEHEVIAAAGDSGGQPDQPRQRARRLHDGCAGTAAERITPVQLDREVEALVEHLGERVRGVQPDRRQHREQLAEEVIPDPEFLRRGPVLAAAEADAFVRKLRQQDFIEERVLRLDQQPDFADHECIDFDRVFAVGAGLVDVELDLLLQAGHPDLDEFVQVGRNDAQELESFQQRHGLVGRLGQDAPVEGQEPEFSVEEVRVGKGTLHDRIANKGTF